MCVVGDALLGSDEGVLAVRSADGSLQTSPWDGNTLVEVFDELAAAGELWVTTGGQWGPFSVTTELTDVAPPDPRAEWEDVVELSVTASGPLVVTELVENDPQVPLTTEAGTYRIRVSARGRRASTGGDEVDDVPESLEPAEWYLLQAWPAPHTEPVVVRLESACARERLAGGPPLLRVPEAEAGLAASVRIGRDVGGGADARTLSGQVGSVEVERTVRGTRRRLFFDCARVTTWSGLCVPGPSWTYMGPSGPDYALGDSHYWASGDYHPDQLSGADGLIRWSFVEVDKPARAVRAWNWVSGSGFPGDRDVSLLAEESIVTTTLDQSKDATGGAWTTIRIRHEGLPVEWLDDMETWWAFQLAIADHAGFGVPR